MVYDTSKESANNTVSLPLAGTVNVTVNWGDGTSNSYTTSGFKTHTYASGGVYTVQVSGTLTSLDHGTGASTTSNKLKLVRCLSFGNVGLTSAIRGFRGCANLVQVPSSLPTGVVNCSEMFRDCTLFNDSRVASWNTTSVQNTSGMFVNCVNFNANLSSWNTGLVADMSNMFYNCPLFSSDLSSWATSLVSNMSNMLYNADAFSSNLSAWGLQGLNANNRLDGFMLAATGLTTPDYDATLVGWNSSKALFRNDLRPNFGGSKYTCGSAAEAARNALVAYGWTITDGGCVQPPSSSSSSSSKSPSSSSSSIGGFSSSSSSFSYNPDKLTLVYDTSKEPANNTISLPLAGTVGVTVDWGDGTSNSYSTTGFKTHNYAAPGVYVVQVDGTLTALDHGAGDYTTSNKSKLVRCLSFGSVGLVNLTRAFRGCSNLVEAPNSLPTTVNNASESFRDCSSFVGSEISGWDISRVTNITGMFVNCVGFNTNLSSWDTGLVTDMSNAFYNCPAFNSDLSAWSTQLVTNMGNMFFNADSYTSNMGGWSLEGLNANIRLDNFMSSASGLSTNDYNSTLIGWNNNKSLFRNDLRPNFGGSKYTAGGAAAAARAALVAYGWTITDGGSA